MHSFAYKNGTLYCENVNLQELADKESTPLYVYSKQTILNHFHRLREALAPLNAEVAYAVKACSNIAILNLMARNGAGFDIVSGGELFRVLKAGGDPSKCTYAGVGKTEQEIRYALAQGIYCFNVESEAELRAINAIAASMGVKAPVAVRVNPNVEAGTHKYITTGKAENKFGVDFERIESLYEMAARELLNLHLKGLQMHIGSQLTQAKPFLEAVRKVAPLAASLKEKHGIEFFSIGGGIGIVYQGTLDSGVQEWWNEDCAQLTLSTYAQAVVPTLQPLGLHIIVEPGRLIVGNAGALITRCLYEKNGKAKTFKIVDAGMNDLIRPALYQGYHEIIPPNPASQQMSWVPSVNPETSSPKTGTCRTCARENSWPYCPPEPMVFPCLPTTIHGLWRKKSWWTGTNGTSFAAVKAGKTSSGENPFRNNTPIPPIFRMPFQR